MEIWKESARFYTSRRLADFAIMILKKSWLSDLEILAICRLINREEYTQEELATRIETHYTENQNTTAPSTTSMLTQEDRKSVE